MLESYSTNQIPFCHIRLYSITCYFLVNNLHFIRYPNSSIVQPHWKKFKRSLMRVIWIFHSILPRFDFFYEWYLLLAGLDLTQARVNSLQTTCILSLIPQTEGKVHFKVAKARCLLKSWLAWLWRQTVQLFISRVFRVFTCNLLETTDMCSCGSCQVLPTSRECISCQKRADLENKTEDVNK